MLPPLNPCGPEHNLIHLCLYEYAELIMQSIIYEFISLYSILQLTATSSVDNIIKVHAVVFIVVRFYISVPTTNVRKYRVSYTWIPCRNHSILFIG